MKTFFSIALALVLLVITLPLIIVVIVLILIFERERPFFSQERLGLYKNPFILYKIRSMRAGQVTPIGRIIRKTGIDELPQLVNIIQGKITFIGPRPLTIADVNRLGWTTDYYEDRWQVKPGLTGLAQLSPTCHKKMSLFWDRFYISNQTVWLDLKVLLATGFVLIFGKRQVINYIFKKYGS